MGSSLKAVLKFVFSYLYFFQNNNNINILQVLLNEVEVGSPGGMGYRENSIPHDAVDLVQHLLSCALFHPSCLPAPFVQAHIFGHNWGLSHGPYPCGTWTYACLVTAIQEEPSHCQVGIAAQGRCQNDHSDLLEITLSDSQGEQTLSERIQDIRPKVMFISPVSLSPVLKNSKAYTG